MGAYVSNRLRRSRLGLLVGLFALSLAGALLMAPARAQETPEGSPQPTPAATTPAGSTGTVVRIEVDPQPEPIKVGKVFEARIVVSNVEHLAGFDFTIQYDAGKLRPVKAEDSASTPVVGTPVPGGEEQSLIQIDQQGAFLAASERGDGIACLSPVATKGQIKFFCSTLGSPPCLGGLAGASGSGLLAVVPLESRGGGLTNIDLTDSTLVSDNVEPCDPNDPDFQPIAIEHTRAGVSVLLAPKPTSHTVLIIVIVVVVLAVVGAGGGGGYWWYRQRSSGASA